MLPLSSSVVTHGTPEFERKLQQTLDAFEEFARGRALARGRFVLYAGVNKPNACDLRPADFHKAIAEWLGQGYVVGWQCCDDCLYLYAQEPGCPIPAPDKLFAEEELADVSAILRAAGFGNAS
jgi:hypothetical protein